MKAKQMLWLPETLYALRRLRLQAIPNRRNSSCPPSLPAAFASVLDSFAGGAASGDPRASAPVGSRDSFPPSADSLHDP